MTELNAKQDLKAKVKEILTEFCEQTDSYVDKLIAADSGAVEAHENAGCNGMEARKIALALAKQLAYEQEPPSRLNTKAFKRDVENYFRLL